MFGILMLPWPYPPSNPMATGKGVFFLKCVDMSGKCVDMSG